MNSFLNDFLAQIKGIWSRLDGGQRLIVVVVSMATVLGFAGVVWYAGRPSYEVVRTAQTTEEATQIRDALEEARISYDVDTTGRSFLVERSKIGLANMALLQAGFDGSQTKPFGTSIIDDAETKAFKLNNAQIAIAQNAILKLDGVVGVTVTASAPKRRAAFRDRDAETRPSATVALRLRPGTAFETVAHNAASLAASQLMVPITNIEVLNSVGGARYKYDPDRNAGAGSGEFFAMQTKMARDRTELAQELLDRMWPGKASVNVTVELNPEWTVKSEKVAPESPMIKTEKTVKDSTESTAGDAENARPGNSKKNEVKDREYVVEYGEKRTGSLAPKIDRVTVAVMYDRSLEQQQGFDKNELARAIKAIVGWDPSRDAPEDSTFSMLAAEFAPLPEVEEITAGGGFAEVALQWGPTVGQILGVVVVVLFLRGLFKRPKSAGASVATTAGGGAAVLPQVDEDKLPPDEQQKRMRREIERSIAQDPAALAKLLEAWLMEQKA